MKNWAYLGFGIACYLIFMVSQLPAARVYAWLQADNQLPLQAYQLRGSVWNGRADMISLGGQTLTDTRWYWRPWMVLTGRAEVSVTGQFHQQPVAMNIEYGLDRKLAFSNVKAELPMATVESLLNPSPLGLAGLLAADIRQVQFDRGSILAVAGELHWRNAGIGAPFNAELGSYSVTLVTEGDEIQGLLKDSEGPVQLDGLLKLAKDGRYQLSATLAVRDPSRTDIKQALGLLGTPSPTGKVSLQRSGKVNLAAFLRL